MRRVRQPAVAGQFYPAEPDQLRASLAKLFASVGKVPEFKGRIVGCVSPHAGYMYSGHTAAHIYHALKQTDFETAVLIGPSHRDWIQTNALFDGDAFLTPLGEVPVDAELADEILTKADVAVASTLGHGQEHALEVQLPFLQSIRPDVRIVPITMGRQDRESCRALADCLAGIQSTRKIVFIASSDLSHYHSYAEARRIDAEAVRLIRDNKEEDFLDALESESIEACGGGPVAVVMKVARAKGATEARVLHSCNSGDVSGDRDEVVGYLSAFFGIPSS